MSTAIPMQEPVASVRDLSQAAAAREHTGREVWRALFAFRREFVLVGLLSALANLLMLTPTLYMLQVYDRVMVSRNELTLLTVSAIVFALFLVMALAERGRSRLLVAAGIRFDSRLSARIFDASFDARVSALNAPGHQPGRPFNDLLQVRQFLTGQGVFAFFDLPWVPLYIGVMFLLHPFLGWLSIGFALFQGALAVLGHRSAVQPAEAAQQAQGEANLYLQGKLRGADAVEAMGMTPHLKGHWWARHEIALSMSLASQSQVHRITAVSKFVRYTQQSLSLGAGALLVIDGQLSPGAMIAANVLMSRALAPIDMLVGSWRGYILAKQAFLRLSSLLAKHPPRDPALQHVQPIGSLSMRSVSAFAPGRGAPILHDVNLELRAGQVLVVLGPSGSGKSTLARVMLGIWGEVRGEVLLGGRPVESWNRNALGPFVGYLPQDIELFEGTIAENIARLGDVDAQRVVAASRATGLHEMILRMAKGYDTQLGEAASLLSGGLRQRLALARAVYGMPQLVVLDEPNANLDEVGEVALAQAVMQLRAQGSAVVMITHRPAAMAIADSLLLLSDGRVKAFGPRDTVLSSLRVPTVFASGATPASGSVGEGS